MVFTKTGAAPRLLAEVDGLAALRASATVRVPKVLKVGADETTARQGGRVKDTLLAVANGGTAPFLELEFLELRPLDRQAGTMLGRQLAALHRVSAEKFGWATDNYIGLTPQQNGWMDSWPRFYAERRLRPQLLLAQGKGMDRKTLLDSEDLCTKVAAFFVAGHPAPSLLHGDLWGGNAGMLPDGTPVVFDPACYFGDREADLAMSELFGGFPDAFQAAYREAWPLSDGYETRKTLYNLYHVLNHYNMFGAGYLGQIKRMIAKLLAELKG